MSLREFQEAVERRIIALGYEMYKQTTPSSLTMRSREPEYADHVTSPEALAFAILHKQFTQAQLGAIHFDHGDGAGTFMNGRIVTLVEDVMKQLTEHTSESVPTPTDIEYCHHD